MTIPKVYYKVICSEKNGMIVLILPSQGSTTGLDQFVVSVDEVKRQIGIDFFSGLDDGIENKMESTVNKGSWDFK